MSHQGKFRFAMALSGAALTLVAASFAPVKAQQSKVIDFGGVWAREAHNYPKPYMAPGRGGGIKDGYNNEYLKPWVVEMLERDDLVTRSGKPVATPHSICYPEGVPYVFGGTQVQILQTPTEITMLFGDPGQSRTIALNRKHPANVKPSWYGDSIGWFEGDELVVDTVGIAANPEAGSMGNYGTPHTDKLHLIERYHFLRPNETSMAPTPKNDSFNADDVIKGGKVLRLTFTLDDPDAYKKPWSVTLDFLPLNARLREYICAENSREPFLLPLLPTAATPDF